MAETPGKTTSKLGRVRRAKRKLKGSEPIISFSEPKIMLMSASPTGAVARTVVVTLVKRLNELHFILQRTRAAETDAVEMGDEAAVCWPVIMAFSSETVGRKVSDIFFYAWFETQWAQIKFRSYSPEKASACGAFEYDSGRALGDVSVIPLSEDDYAPKTLTDDFTSGAFAYWHYFAVNADRLGERLFNQALERTRPVRKTVPIGTECCVETQHVESKCIAALKESILIDRINVFKAAGLYVSSSDTYKGYGRKGFFCNVYLRAKIERSLEIMEPGYHRVSESLWNAFRKKILAMNGQIREAGENRFEVILELEVDMTKPDGGYPNLLTRGNHLFEIDLPPPVFADDFPF